MTIKVEEVIARVPFWSGSTELKIIPLGGGITNQNYRVDVGGEAFVLRIAGANTDLLGINRDNEFAANKAAGELGIAPEVVYFIKPEGYLVTRFIHGRPLLSEEIRQPDVLRQVAETLKTIHNMPAIPGKFSAFGVVRNYTKVANGYGITFPENFEWLVERMQEAENVLRSNSLLPKPCHNDLLNENFLYDARVRILDWEYAGIGDVFFDLANLSVNHDFLDEQDCWLLECYFGQVTASQLARLKIMKIMSDFRESMWGLVQIGLSQLDFDFRGYADKHFQRMTRNMQDPQWGQWLKEISENV